MPKRTILLALVASVPLSLLLMANINAAAPATAPSPPAQVQQTPAVLPPDPGAVVATCPGTAATGIASVPAPAADCPSTGPIVALGTSITYGYGVTMTAYSTPPQGSYPSDLQAMLGIPVVNAGVNGETAYAVLHPDARGYGHRPPDLQLPALLALHPRLVIVEFGLAEAVYGWPIADAATNLDQILHVIGDIPTVIVGEHLDCSLVTFCRGGRDVKYTDAWDVALREVAARHHSGLVLDATAGLAAAGETVDGLHPDIRGYRILADRVAPVVAARLAEAARGGDSGGSIVSQ